MCKGSMSYIALSSFSLFLFLQVQAQEQENAKRTLDSSFFGASDSARRGRTKPLHAFLSCPSREPFCGMNAMMKGPRAVALGGIPGGDWILLGAFSKFKDWTQISSGIKSLSGRQIHPFFPCPSTPFSHPQIPLSCWEISHCSIQRYQL